MPKYLTGFFVRFTNGNQKFIKKSSIFVFLKYTFEHSKGFNSKTKKVFRRLRDTSQLLESQRI